jgi:hypothetical protein
MFSGSVNAIVEEWSTSKETISNQITQNRVVVVVSVVVMAVAMVVSVADHVPLRTTHGVR